MISSQPSFQSHQSDDTGPRFSQQHIWPKFVGKLHEFLKNFTQHNPHHFFKANRLIELFPGLEELYLADNGLRTFGPTGVMDFGLGQHLRLLDVQQNPIGDIRRLAGLFQMPKFVGKIKKTFKNKEYGYFLRENQVNFSTFSTPVTPIGLLLKQEFSENVDIREAC